MKQRSTARPPRPDQREGGFRRRLRRSRDASAPSSAAAPATVTSLIVNLARRNQGLLARQLELVERLQTAAGDPDRLAELLRLDQLSARMRRNEQSIIVLAGAQPGAPSPTPVSLSEVVHAAVAEVDDAARPRIELADEVHLDAAVAAAFGHLVAELVENATHFSPPTMPVTVCGRVDGDRYVLQVLDRGLGIGDELGELNQRLADPLAAELDAGDALGLHVVARIAARHGISVRLSRNADGGATATVVAPLVELAGARAADAGGPPVVADHSAGVHVAASASAASPAVAVVPAPPAALHPIPEPAAQTMRGRRARPALGLTRKRPATAAPAAGFSSQHPASEPGRGRKASRKPAPGWSYAGLAQAAVASGAGQETRGAAQGAPAGGGFTADAAAPSAGAATQVTEPLPRLDPSPPAYEAAAPPAPPASSAADALGFLASDRVEAPAAQPSPVPRTPASAQLWASLQQGLHDEAPAYSER